jgi:hypothetical protein
VQEERGARGVVGGNVSSSALGAGEEEGALSGGWHAFGVLRPRLRVARPAGDEAARARRWEH